VGEAVHFSVEGVGDELQGKNIKRRIRNSIFPERELKKRGVGGTVRTSYKIPEKTIKGQEKKK